MTQATPPFNYRYFTSHAERAQGRVLDYGCGIGQTVGLALGKGVDIWGADTYAGPHYADWANDVQPEIRSRIRKIENDRCDFPDGHFAMVMSNQVIEHVTNPEAVFADIHRMLAPGGVFMAAFPVTETWYEGHVGLYFAHRFAPGPLRDAFFSASHRLGAGLYRGTMTRQEWVRMSENTLDDVCFYYPARRIYPALRTIFGAPVQDMAVDYMRTRLGARAVGVPRLADPLLRFVYHKRAGEIFQIRKA